MRPAVQNSDDICAIFAQHRGVFDNWRKATLNSAARYHIDPGGLLATIKAESSFYPTARTPWRKLLGIIPYGRVSSAYGYAQALDGTWLQYEKSTGEHFAYRSSFTDSVDFVAWYYRQTIEHTDIEPHDWYNLYIAYVIGWNAFNKYGAKNLPVQLKRKAREVALQARIYQQQLYYCEAR